MIKKLSVKQLRFVQEYLIDLNATQAAIRAGYSEKTAKEQGSRLLTNVNIKAAIDRAIEERAGRTEIHQDYVLKNLKEISDRCMQAVPVKDRTGQMVFVENKDGILCPAFTFNAHGAIRSNELIGKHLGMFNDRVEHSGKINHELKGKVEVFQEILREIDGKTAHLVEH